MRTSDRRLLLLAGLVLALRANAQLNRPFDPKSTLSKPAPSQQPHRPVFPLSPFPAEKDFRFYNLRMDQLTQSPVPYPAFRDWYKSYSDARALRGGTFPSLDVYDRWFLSIPGGGVQMAASMMNVYLADMPENIKAQYYALKYPAPTRPVKPPPPDPSPTVEEGRRLRSLKVQAVGSSYVVVLGPGRIVTEGDTFSTTNRGTIFAWKVGPVAPDGGRFFLLGKVRPEPTVQAAPTLWTGGQIFWVFFWSMALFAAVVVYATART